jgi:hypothetical protein
VGNFSDRGWGDSKIAGMNGFQESEEGDMDCSEPLSALVGE